MSKEKRKLNELEKDLKSAREELKIAKKSYEDMSATIQNALEKKVSSGVLRELMKCLEKLKKIKNEKHKQIDKLQGDIKNKNSRIISYSSKK